MNQKPGTSHTPAHSAPNKQFALALAALIAVAVVGVCVFIGAYRSYIDGVLYAERLNQMSEVTKQFYTGIEEVVSEQWDDAESQTNYLLDEQPATSDALVSFMVRQSQINSFDDTQTDLVAVDETGRYYTEDGMRGALAGMDYLIDAPERISYVKNTLTTGETRMVFLLKLPEKVTMQVGNHTVALSYYGISRNMEQLEPFFTCAAYGGSNSVYVLDESGAKIFSGSGDSLLSGHNLFNVLSQMDYLHNSSFDQAKSDLDANGVSYSNAVLDGNEYYYSLYRMENASWTLLFLVPSEYVATNTVALIDTTTRTIMIFAGCLVVVCAAIIFLALRLKQKQVLDAERRNSEILASANRKLDQKNAELSLAIETAEAAKREAEAASKAKSEFLSNMSHDIRTPMNAIVGITNLMEHEGAASDRLRGYIKKIKFSSRHLLSLINDILDMSKIESSEVELNIDKISLAEQIGQVDSIIRSQTNERGQVFAIRTHDIAHEYLIGDGVRLRQIFLNLLSNSVKYTQNEGAILFDITEIPCNTPGFARFTFVVADNGCGMEEETIEHIFEPFTRAENSVTNKVQGTGLGMAITKNIVDLMGGTIDIKSRLDHGSRFTVTISFRIDEEAFYSLGDERVLLISDDEELTRNVNTAVNCIDLPFTVVSTEREAREHLERNRADVILLAGHLRDKSLPDSVAVLRALAADAMLIFCVDFAQRDRVQQVLAQAGVDGLIRRPFFLSDLQAAIDNARATAAPEGNATSILRGMRFLCAEDNELNAEILDAILAMYGATCTIYPDGEQIVRAFENVKPGEYDAILMDIQMPHMNGYDATHAIRAGENPIGRTIPIIAMTANAFSDDVQNSIAAGMDAHVSKPLDITVLEKTVRNLITPPRH